MTEVTRVLTGSRDSAVLVKVIGRGTMEYCSELFEQLGQKIDANPVSRIYFDLSESSYLDSSFIGVIVSVQKKLDKLQSGGIIVLNPSEKVREILATMGLIEILPIQEGNEVRNIDLDQEIIQKLDRSYKDIQLLLESHQSLMELSTENRKRFSLVEEMLKKELERQKHV